VIKVVLVDDQPLVRAGLQRILASDSEFSVMAECSDGAEALAALGSVEADVVLMDVRMRGMDGMEATRRVRDLGGPPVLILTTFDDDEVLWGAIEAGAAGFVLKEASAENLIAATRVVAGGGAWLDPAVTGRVLEVTRRAGLPKKREADRITELTDRELEVLQQMAKSPPACPSVRRPSRPTSAPSSPNSRFATEPAPSCLPTNTASCRTDLHPWEEVNNRRRTDVGTQADPYRRWR
jgi:DNA-binding NarL/FixJ family response regulator